LKLLGKRYKGFLNVYYSNKNKKFYLQQNPKSGSWYSQFYPRLYWELKNYPEPGKLKYTGNVLDKWTGAICHKSRF
jgi:hypothetical protein